MATEAKAEGLFNKAHIQKYLNSLRELKLERGNITMSQLSGYIKMRKSMGYDVKSIPNFLLSPGNSSREINMAISEVSGRANKKSKALLYPIILVIALSFVLILWLFFSHLKDAPKGFTLYIQVDNKNKTLSADEKLMYTLNSFSKEDYDASLIFRITKIGVERTALSKENRIMLKKNKLNTIRDNLITANLSSGTYRLSAEALSRNIKKTAYDLFYVKEKAEINYNTTTFVNGEEIEMNAAGQVNSTKKSEAYDMNEILNFDKAGAQKSCAKIEDKGKSEECLALLAQKTKDSSICSRIGTALVRDGCFASLALEGDFTLCENIEDEYQREACISIGTNQKNG